MRPDEIESASMEIISREMGEWSGPEEDLPVLKRVIHASADFDFVRTLKFSVGAVKAGREAIRRGAAIVTDTAMAAAGISKVCAARWGAETVCRMADPDVRDEAARRCVTRASVCIERAAEATPDALFVIGNAPTALIRLCELIREGRAAPSLVVGVPVGFVNVVESKEMLAAADVPYIAAMGRKGGSTIAAAIVNALLYGMEP